MIRVRPAEERGKTRRDWLDSRHTFHLAITTIHNLWAQRVQRLAKRALHFLQIWIVPDEMGLALACSVQSIYRHLSICRLEIVVTICSKPSCNI